MLEFLKSILWSSKITWMYFCFGLLNLNFYFVQGTSEDVELKPGENTPLFNACIGTSDLEVKVSVISFQ